MEKNNIFEKKIVLLFAFLLLCTISAFAINSTNYNIDASTTSSGGGTQSSSGYSTNTIIGTISGETNSTGYKTLLGFFYGGGSGSSEEAACQPLITFVSNTSIGSVTLNNAVTSGGLTTVRIWFIANCSNGREFLDATSATANFTKQSEVPRYTTTCTRQNNLSAYASNFSCDITMYYYDAAGNWGINVTINTTSDAKAYNDTTTFPIISSMDLNLSATSVAWPTLSPAQTNQQATGSPPLTITNIYNSNITNISINAIDLVGQSGTNLGVVFSINGNFTAKNDTATVCTTGTGLINNTAVNMTLLMYRNTRGTQSQPMYYCIPTVPNLPPGIYNTTTWTTEAEV